MKRIIACFVALLLGASMMPAQLTTATVLGVVKDPSGAVVPGAKVTARDTDTGQTRTGVTGTDGTYRMDALPVGNYQITVEATGFQTEVQTGLTLTVGQEAVINFALQVGQATQTISVTGQAEIVSTTTSSLSTVVAPQTIADLPLNGRNYNSLTLLQPGITESSTTGSTAVGWAGIQYSSNGAGLRANNYLLDGGPQLNGYNLNAASSTGSTLGVDGIQEYRVITTGFDAEYGEHMGSQMLIVSKGGTNQFHGDAFEYFRNSSLDARNAFDLLPSKLPSGVRLPPFRRNDFGGSLGGPIQKDKMFFFGVYEGLRAVLGTTNTDITLAPACIGPAGATITQAECPQLNGASAKIAPQMAGLIALYPAPNLPNNEYGFVFNQDTTENYTQLRLDRTISSSDSAFARYTFDKAYIPYAYQFNYSYAGFSSQSQFGTVGWNHIFSTNLLNTARVSYGRTFVGNSSILINPLLGEPGYVTVPGNQLGSANPGSVTAMGTDTVAPRSIAQNLFTGGDDINYNRGHHSFKFGALVNIYTDDVTEHGYDKGVASFSGLVNFYQAFESSYEGFAPGGSFSKPYRFNQFGFYGQDAWRVTPRLTLNLGMRYEPTSTVSASNGKSAAIRNIATDTSFTLGPLFRNPSLRNWSPRVGFAWDVFGNGKTAFRGGWDMLYDTDWAGSAMTLSAESNVPFSYPFTQVNTTYTLPYVTPVIGTFPPAAKGFVWAENNPHLMTYNLTVEQQLPGQMALTVSYVGSRGWNLFQGKEYNPEVPTGVPLANGGTECVPAPPGTKPNLANQYDGSATSCYLLNSPRFNPAFNSLTLDPTSGNALYNGVQVNLAERLSHGFQFQASYTFSRLIDDQQGEGDSDGWDTFEEPLHYESERGPADFNAENVFHWNGIYHLPNFTGSNGLVGKLSNGWWLSGIVSIQSGRPFEAVISGDSARTDDGEITTIGASTDTPDLVPGFNHYNMTHGVTKGCGTGITRQAGGSAIAAGTPLHSRTLFYDPCAFSVQPAGFVGTEPRNIMTGPGYDDVDTSIVKDTPAKFLGEGGQVEFRAEFFNVFNHPNFALPGTTAVSASCNNSPLACTTATQNPLSSGGLITATNGTSRQIQFALKILF
jgi:hypothetical protein